MPYVLGIDVGTSRTAAALCRSTGSAEGHSTGSTWADAEVVQLGERTPGAPTVVYFAADGTVIVGDAAQRAAVSDPANAARGFARRIGDDVPLMIGGEVCTAEALTAVLVTWVVDEVATAEGERPDHIVVTHPAGWGNYRRRLLHRALRQINLDNVTLLPVPVAVGESHAAVHEVPTGRALAVYDLGASGLSAAVVRRSPVGTFELLNSAESVEPNGGDSFDDAIFEHVRATAGDIDHTDPDAWTKLIRLRQECTAAKEFLSASTDVTVRQIQVTRGEFEDLIRPAIEAGIEDLLRTIRPVPADDLDAVVLTGGSARIPLVVELVTAQLRDQATVVPEPELACARGAAIAAQRLVPAPQATALALVDEEAPPPPPRPAIDIAPLELPKPRSAMRAFNGMNRGVLGAAGVLVAAAGVALTFYLRPDPEPPKPAPTAGTSSVAPVNAGKTATTTTQSKPTTQKTGEDGR
jgi:molecular chaperone DnaK